MYRVIIYDGETASGNKISLRIWEKMCGLHDQHLRSATGNRVGRKLNRNSLWVIYRRDVADYNK